MRKLTPEERAQRICKKMGQSQEVDPVLCVECGLNCYSQLNCGGEGHCGGGNVPIAITEKVLLGELTTPHSLCGGNICATCTLHEGQKR